MAFTGLIYAGRSTIRHDSEPAYRGNDDFDSREEYREALPHANPHVFVRYTDVDVVDALVQPKLCARGSSGVIVQYQKLARDQHTMAEVNAWRDGFDPGMLEPDQITFPNHGEDAAFNILEEITYGEPFVILDANDPALDVPAQPEDMLEAIREVSEDLAAKVEGNEELIRQVYEKMRQIA